MRLTILAVVVVCLFAALFARLWYLQVINAPAAQAAAQNNGVRSSTRRAPGPDPRPPTAGSSSTTGSPRW